MQTLPPFPAPGREPAPGGAGLRRAGRGPGSVARSARILAILLAACIGLACGDGPPPPRGGPGGDDGVGVDVGVGPPSVPEGACREAAYLCPGLVERGQVRVMRWGDATAEIRVRIPRPAGQPAPVARALQDAAAAGVRTWQDRPFPLRILRSDDDLPADIVVRWVARMDGAELGRAATEWRRDADGAMAMRVRDFVLAVENPYRSGALLDPASVRLTAAHEMGHALGLPHSDSPRDVMYPTNTASSLSARDYRAMNGLYALENGALLPAETGGPGS